VGGVRVLASRGGGGWRPEVVEEGLELLCWLERLLKNDLSPTRKTQQVARASEG
jgi:hypothetical protein